MRVAILPTGRMELLGVPRALAALFPDHEFYGISQRRGDAEPSNSRRRSARASSAPASQRPVDVEPFDSFTSSGQELTRTQKNPNLVEIVEQMTSELVPGRRGHPPDLLFVLEDLELPNRHQPELVVQVFRDATLRHLALLESTDPGLANRVAQALRSKASFHLATPMIEAWLFADPNGPRNAGVPADRLPPNWESERDPEAFLTRDPAFLADDGSTCTAWHALSRAKKKTHKLGWNKEQRESHPKAFLSWLCRDPAEKNCSRYRESHEGADALAALDWEEALRLPEHCTYLRALVEDLADGLGETLRLPGGSVSPHTDRRVRRQPPVLRNI
jgi:hypothetical protein